MKKLLLGSTALVVGGLMAAPAMAADPIKIGVGGYYTFYAIAGGIQSTYATNGTWAQYKGLTATVTQSLNDKMIKSYGDELGTQSYGAVVDLLVNYYA